MTSPFDTWSDIIDSVIELITSNFLTGSFFYVMVVSILIDVICAVFNKDGTRKNGN